MILARVIILFLTVSFLSSSLRAQVDLCLSFECGDLNSLQEHGYYLYANEGSIQLDQNKKAAGAASLSLTQPVHDTSAYVTFNRKLPAHLFSGHTLQLGAQIGLEAAAPGTQASAIVFASAIDTNQQPLAGTSSQDQVIHSGQDFQSVTIELNVPTGIGALAIGGILRGPATAWFDDLQLKVDGVPYVANAGIPKIPIMLPARPEVEWLRQYVHPLKTVDPRQKDDTDLHALGNAIGESAIVGLGENTHGSHEIFQLKRRLFDYLHRHKDFAVFALESDFAGAPTIDRQIQGAPLDSVSVLKTLGYPVWRTQEVYDMIEGMRRRRAGAVVTFAGVDNQFFRPAYDSLKVELGSQHPDIFDRLYDLLALIHMDNNESRGRTEVEPRYATKAQQGFSVIRQAIDKGDFTEKRAAWLRQLLRQLEMTLEGGSANRDAHMAENLLWWRQQSPTGKVAVWAHNEHIKTVKPWMGSHLETAVGDDYVAVGFTFAQGNYSATTVPLANKLSPVEAQPAYSGTYEAIFAQVDEPLFFIDLRRIAGDTSSYARWFTENLGFRKVGTWQPPEEFGPENLVEAYDIMIFIKESTPTYLIDLSY